MTDDVFPANERVQGQVQSRKAYEDFLAQQGAFSWAKDFAEICALWPDWRKAAYIAWAASPLKDRKPETQEELARSVLGLNSDRMISTWRKRQPAIDEMIKTLQVAPLMRHRRDVIDALVKSASDADPKSHPDRKLFLEITGDYKPRTQTEVTGKDGGAIATAGTIEVRTVDYRTGIATAEAES